MADGGGWVQYANSQGFYQQGSYTAEQASYSHHDNYVYRSSDVAGEHPDPKGKYFHLLLVSVLRGKPLVTGSEVWKGQAFGSVQAKLGGEYDSVEGGPHRPTKQGGYGRGEEGSDDSIMYVTYHPSQCLPEFIVTYTEAGVDDDAV